MGCWARSDSSESELVRFLSLLLDLMAINSSLFPSSINAVAPLSSLLIRLFSSVRRSIVWFGLSRAINQAVFLGVRVYPNYAIPYEPL
jgi:hypothetical protein